MWQSVPYITGGFALAAFLIAAVLLTYRSAIEQKRKLIQLANEEDRAALVQSALEVFRVDAANLPAQRRYEIAVFQIQARGQRFLVGAVVVSLLSILSAGVTLFAIARLSGYPATAGHNLLGEFGQKIGGRKVHDGQLVSAQSPAGTLFQDCAHCPVMVVVPAGQFRMGSDPREIHASLNEQPQHFIEFSQPFAISVYETRFSEWDSAVSKGHLPAPIDSVNGVGAHQGWGRENRPVINVRFAEALLFVDWLNQSAGKAPRYRLPSEAEWEYVARAGSVTAYNFGESFNPSLANNGREGTLPSGSFPPNAFGVYDMHGNVWEWTSDCWRENYVTAPIANTSCPRHAIRGGSWGKEPEALRSASRMASQSKGYRLGFRVVRDL